MIFLKKTSFVALLILIIGCSKDFLNENTTSTQTIIGKSNIFVSNNWPQLEYHFKIPNTKEGKYEIISKPSWLKINSLTGELKDSIADIICSVDKKPEFSAIGVYTDFFSVKLNENEYKIPANYIIEGNPKARLDQKITTNTDYTDLESYLTIFNEGMGILLWNINTIPQWLSLDTNNLEFNGICIRPYSSYNIPLKYNLNYITSSRLTGKIVISTNDQNNSTVELDIALDTGSPILSYITDKINFSSTEISKEININNYGNGLLVWAFQNIPEWLSISPQNGTCSYNYSNKEITIKCNHEKLLPGENTATIILKSNDINQSEYKIVVSVIAPGISKNIFPIKGNVIDAIYNQESNVLYYITSAPNKLILFDATNKTTINEFDLSSTPTAFSVSEDWSKVGIGHNGLISYINLKDNSIFKQYEINYSVNCIAWAENDWFCYTQNGGYRTNLHWININNGELYDDTTSWELDNASVIYKIPNHSYLLASRKHSSPNGIYVYDISSKKQNNYIHDDFYNYWFSKDGTKTISSDFNVYKTTSIIEYNNNTNIVIAPIAKINLGNNYFDTQFINHSQNNIWVLQNNDVTFSYPYIEIANIYKINASDYSFLKEYKYQTRIQPNENTAEYNISAKYIFENIKNQDIVLLCKGVNNESWLAQILPIN